MPYISEANSLDFAIKVISARMDFRRREIAREKSLLEIELRDIRSQLENSEMSAAVVLYQESAAGIETAE